MYAHPHNLFIGALVALRSLGAWGQHSGVGAAMGINIFWHRSSPRHQPARVPSVVEGLGGTHQKMHRAPSSTAEQTKRNINGGALSDQALLAAVIMGAAGIDLWQPGANGQPNNNHYVTHVALIASVFTQVQHSRTTGNSCRICALSRSIRCSMRGLRTSNTRRSRVRIVREMAAVSGCACVHTPPLDRYTHK